MLGGVTGLAQAYGVVNTSLASLTRAPGGTFGNRNFMAHLSAIGTPIILLCALEARRSWGFVLGTIGRRVLEKAFENSVKAIEARNNKAERLDAGNSSLAA